MNPFNQVQKNIQKSIQSNLERKRKKTNTFLTGWLDSKDELLVHHKIKKSLGCNGSVKYKREKMMMKKNYSFICKEIEYMN